MISEDPVCRCTPRNGSIELLSEEGVPMDVMNEIFRLNLSTCERDKDVVRSQHGAADVFKLVRTDILTCYSSMKSGGFDLICWGQCTFPGHGLVAFFRNDKLDDVRKIPHQFFDHATALLLIIKGTRLNASGTSAVSIAIKMFGFYRYLITDQYLPF